ncbi:MAG TPA: hypothetical protein VNS60_01275 [Solirubrobacterales bacterium]|nr:hypothetical protein [Solirubrobacterales bacterium]
MAGDPSWRKFLTEARRRGWVVVLSLVLVVAVAWVVGKALPPSSNAEAVLVVRAAGPLSEQPNSSTKLAATYATLIPLDARIERTVERALPGGSTSYTTSNDPNTAVLRVNFSADSKSEAIRGAAIVAHAVSGPRPVSQNITRNTIAIASLPSSASESGASADLIAVAALLGLLLGFVLLAFWRPRDARVDTLAELRGQFECPCLELHLSTMSGLRPLFEALAGASGRTTVVVPCRTRDGGVADSLSQLLNKAFGQGSVTRVDVPGSEEAGELAAANADITILVVGPGARVAALREAADILARYGAAPDYAVLALDGRGPAGGSAGQAEASTGDLPAQVPG